MIQIKILKMKNSKPKPYKMQDKEGASLIRIKNCLYPNLT